MKQPTISNVLLGIAATNWQLSSSLYSSSITLPMWLIKMFQYRGLRVQRCVTSGSIAGLSIMKFCRDGTFQIVVFCFSWPHYSGHCVRNLQYFAFSFSAKLECDLLKWNYIIGRKAEAPRMAYILAILFRGFRRWDVDQHTAIWVAVVCLETSTHSVGSFKCQCAKVPQYDYVKE
jgi:hypothetical protein